MERAVDAEPNVGRRLTNQEGMVAEMGPGLYSKITTRHPIL